MARKPGYGLRQDSRGRWIATVSIAGQRRYRVLGGVSRRVAERLAVSFASECAVSERASTAGSVSELCDRWLALGPSTGLSSSYQRSSREVIDTHIRPAIGHLLVARLTVADVDKMLARLERRRGPLDAPLSPATQRKVARTLVAVLRLAEREELVTRNVARLATVPRQPQAPHRLPTAAAVTAAVEAAWKLGPMPGILVELAAVTGARRGELVALRWVDVDLEQGLVTIAGSLTGLPGGSIERGPTKTRQTRTLALPDQLVARLHTEHTRQTLLLDGASPTWLAWSDVAGRTPWRPDRLSKTWERIRAEIPDLADIRLHDLRHWVGSELIEAGESLVSAAAQLGHSSTAMLASRYGHPTHDAARRRAAVLGAKLGQQQLEA